MPRHRYAVLDTYRFFAALGVVIYHFESHFSPLRGQQTYVLDRFQSLVDFFFVLSGFVLMHTYGDRIRTLGAYGDFLRRRLARIYPLQLATVLICVVLAIAVALRDLAIHDHALIDMDLVPQNLLLVQAWGTTGRPGLNFPSWSISAEAFVYLLFPAFAMAVFRLGAARTLILAVAVACAMELGRAALGMRSGFIATFDYGMLRAVPTFLAGMAVCRIVESRPALAVSWAIPNALVALLVVLMIVQAPFAIIDALYPLLVGLIAAADRGGRPTRLAAPGFVMLGNASFAIYMLHTFVEIACVNVLRRFGWTSLPALYAVAAVGTIVIVAIGLLSYRYFESPLRRRLGGSRRHRPQRAPSQDPLMAGR